MGRLEGKVVLITGAAHGIGRAALELFAAEGARIAAMDWDGDALCEAVASLEAEALAFPGDVSDPKALDRVLEETLEEFGALHGLAHFAGAADSALHWRLGLKAWERVLKVNLESSFLLVQKAGAVMEGGSIVLTGSVAALGALGLAHYAASKAALIGLTRTLALELAPKGVRVNLLVPGYIATRMTASLPEWAKRREVEACPLGRAGRPEEVAQAALFLLSEEAGFTTGYALYVDGGRSVLGAI